MSSTVTSGDNGVSETPENDKLASPSPQDEDDPESILKNEGDAVDRGEPIEQEANPMSTNEADTVNLTESKMNPNDDSEEYSTELTENVYSIMYIAKVASPAFLFALFVFLFQMTIIALMLFDLFDHYNRSENPFNVPPGVTTQVKVAQAFALLLAVAVQGDVIASVVMLQGGYNEQVLEQCPGATRLKWFLSCILQLAAGSSLLMTIFTLIMQSSTVISMMLNFAALNFVSEIDDVAFSLAKKGFLSEALEKKAEMVAGLRLPTTQTNKKLRCVLFFLIYGGLMAGYGVITSQQADGDFLCQTLYVQWGDGFASEASAFSGIYDQTGTLKNGRVTYIERLSGKAMLGYCGELNSWTFTRWFDNSTSSEIGDPCNWQYKSPQTDSFDITTTSDSTWVIKVNDKGGVEQFQTFVLVCVDCQGTSDACMGNGQCSDNQCVCNNEWYGTACKFSEPCPSIAVDARTDPFPVAFNEYEVSEKYDLFVDDDEVLVVVYDKPVYAFYHGSYWSLMMFLGRRWVSTSTQIFEEFPSLGILPNATRAELAGFLEDFHAYYTPIPAFFISDPMDTGTPADALAPVGLGWFRTKSNSLEGLFTRQVDTSQLVDTVMLCSACDDFDNACFAGNCTDRVCSCREGFEGVLCELNVNISEARLLRVCTGRHG